MTNNTVPKNLLATDQPDLFFEDNPTGRLKKEVWDASDEEIDAILTDYGIPSPVEWAKAGSYIQTTTRWKVEENRKKNDVVFIPVGCTELHGRHLPSAADTLYVSAICEGVRRYTAKRGAAVKSGITSAHVRRPPISPFGYARYCHRARACGA